MAQDQGTLFVVATPIGNLDDITRRAVNVLTTVATIAAEDTRRTRALLGALGVTPPRLVSLHDHNETRVTEQLVKALRNGEDIALVSDAGTPLVSDPGFELVRSCSSSGIAVTPIPGPSALAAAISVCPVAAGRVPLRRLLADASRTT